MAVPQAQLAEAFAAFNQLSLELSTAYADLERRVAALNAELAAARSARLRELAEKERLAQRLGGILEALPGAVVVLDAAGAVAEANPAACDWLGEPLLGQPWQDVAIRALSRDATGDWRLADGRWVRVAMRALEAEPGMIVLLTDETEARALREVAARNQRLAAMGEMVAGMAHQLRTPLTSALLYVSQVAAGTSEGEGGRRLAGKGLTRLRQLERTINDMLTFARGATPGAEAFTSAQLLCDLAATLEPQLSEHAASLVLEDGAGDAPLTGNRELLLGALLNLATNALEACGRGARLAVRTRRERGAVRIEFADDGPGIPEALRARIFEPFFTTRARGTGLGLAVVQAVLESHGGSIALADADAGTTFVLTLPAGGAPGLLPSGGEPGRAAARTKNHEVMV